MTVFVNPSRFPVIHHRNWHNLENWLKMDIFNQFEHSKSHNISKKQVLLKAIEPLMYTYIHIYIQFFFQFFVIHLPFVIQSFQGKR